ncbi:MAG: NUDIX domain-containing protein [Clostridiales bacterium]|nr:NUDIX domain-containing protein [Clostridiales bacterium]
MELWDLYTRDREPTGEIHIRGEKLPPERYHLVVHVWIRNSRGEWLISQRAASRPTFPLMWESVGGSVTAGEDSLTGAIREAKEEVGVDLDPTLGKLVNSTVREHFQDIKDVWVFLYDGEIDLRNATTDEVADMRWMTVAEIRALYESGELVHTLGYFFEEQELGGLA